MTFQDFRDDIISKMNSRPSWSRKGQFVFNYIDEKFGIARQIQFIDNLDCFYNDDLIEPFIARAYCVLIDNKLL